MNPFELFQQLLSMSVALNSTVIVVSKSCSFPMSAVSLYEPGERLDGKDKPTGVFVPQITLSGVKEIDLTKEQNDLFKPIWNQKVGIDDKLRACVTAMDTMLLPGTTEAQPPQS